MPKLARIAAIAAAVVLSLGVGVTLVVRSQVDPAKLKALIETEAGKALGRTVKVGSVSASWGAAVAITDLQIMDAEGKAPQVTLGFARVSVALTPLLHGAVKLASVSLDGLSVTAARNADGTLDSADVLAKLGLGAAGAGKASGAPDPVTVSFSNTKIELADATGAGPARLRWSDVQGSISSGEDISLGLAGKLDVPGAKGAADMVLASRVTVTAEYHLSSNEGKVTVAGRDVALERVRAAVPMLRTVPVAASGNADASVTVGVAGGKPSLGAVSASLHDVQVAGAVALSGISGELNYSGTSLDVNGLALQVGALHVVVPRGTVAMKPGGVAADEINLLVNDLPVRLSLSVAGWPAAPQGTLHVTSPNADLAKVSPLLSGHVDVDLLVNGSPAQRTATGAVKLNGPVKATLPESAGGLVVQVSGGAITLNGQDVSATDITCQVLGITTKPRLQITSLFAGPQVAFDSGPLTVDLAKLPEQLTGALAERVKGAAPQGTVKLALRASGPLASPRLAGQVEPDGVSVQVPGTTRRVTLSRGKVEIEGSRAVLSGISLVHEGVSVLMSGGIEGLTGTPRVSLDVAGRNLQVQALAALLPPESAKQLEPYQASGQVDIEALVAGTAATIRADARIGLRALSLTAPVGERKVPVTLTSGALEVSPTAITCQAIEGVAEGVPFQVSGSVRDYLTEPAFAVVAVARNLSMERLKGFVPESVVAEITKRNLQLAFDAKATLKGTKSKPEVALRVLPTAGSVPLPVAGRTLVASLSPGGEVGMEGKTILLTGLPITVAQNTVKISGTVKDPQGEGALDLKIEGQGLNLAGLAPMMPEAARRTLAQAQLRGGKGLVATIGGTIAAPAIDAVVDLGGAAFASLGPLGSGSIPHGILKLSASGVVIQDLTVQVGTAPFAVTGKVAISDPPSISIAVRGDAVDLAGLSRSLPLPPGTSLDGTSKLDVRIEGTPTAPRVTGRVGLAGIGLKSSMLPVPVRGYGGDISLSGEDIVINDGSFYLGNSLLNVKGRIVHYAHEASLDGMEVGGPIDIGEYAPRYGYPLSGKGTFQAKVTGTAHEPVVQGTLGMPSGVYAQRGSAAIPIKNLSVEFSKTPVQTKIGSFSAQAAGGKVSGSASLNPMTGQSVFQVQISAANLAQLAPANSAAQVAGHLDVDFNGTSTGGAAGLSGSGNARVDDLIVDVNSLGAGFIGPGGAALVGAAGAALGSLLGDQSLGQKTAAQAQFYQSVLAQVQQRHDLGQVTAPLSASGGTLRIERIQSPKLDGRVIIVLPTSALSGRFDKIQLGTANVPMDLGGTTSAPLARPDKSNITVDGKKMSDGAAGTANTSIGQDVKASAAKKLLGNGAGGIASQLLGGGDSSDDSSQAAPQAGASTPPAQQPKPKNVLGGLLKGLLK